MAHHEISMPISEGQARALRVNDTVTLRGALYGIRDATQIHMFDRRRKTRFDLAGHAVIHTAPNVKKVEKGVAHPAGYAPLCVGTTTTDRMERLTRARMQQYGVRLIIGKGGLQQKRALYGLIEKYFPEMVPGEHYRPITDQELKRTSVYAIQIESWSGKRNWKDRADQSAAWPPLGEEWFE